MTRTTLITAVVAAGVIATAGAATAQTSDLLNTLEVKRLVEGGGPADHVGLRDHFLALAIRYDVDAARQEALSKAFAGNPNRTRATKPGAHAARLAALARESAATARELAVYHERVAAGDPAAPSKDAARFHAGKGAPEPTDAQLRQLAATAKTPGDHRSLEEYFVTLAAKYRSAAEDHATMARTYRVQPNRRTGGGDPATHCDRMVKLSREAADEADAAALLHRQLARLG